MATDVQMGMAVLFSQEDTPQAEVAEAVAASIAIPIVFRPVTMDSHAGGPYADGGLTYNLPVGVFAEEKLAYERNFPSEPPVPILAFTLEAAAPTENAAPLASATLQGYLSATMHSAVFGSQEISRRWMADLILVPLHTELDLLGFDADWVKVVRAFDDGRVDALRVLRRSLRLRPDRVRAELSHLADVAKGHIEAAERVKQTRLRVALVAPFGAKSLRVMHSFGMEEEADDRMVFDREGPGVPRAFRERDLIAFAVETDGDKLKLPVPWMMTKYEQALLWPALRSVLAVPIFLSASEWAKPAGERDTPLGVLVFDSDGNILQSLESETVQDWLINRSVAAASNQE